MTIGYPVEWDETSPDEAWDLPGSPRIPGTGLTLTVLDPVDHNPVNFWADAIEVVLNVENKRTSETLNASDMPIATTGRWYFEVTAVQSTAEDSLWSLLWGHEYETVPVIYAPHGNTEPTPDQPHFAGRANLGRCPSLGGTAGQDVEYTFTTRLWLDCKPARIVGVLH